MSELLRYLDAAVSAVAEGARRSLVQIHHGHEQGAGTIWHPDGLIMTNAHVVGRSPLRVTLPDGRKLPARVLARSKALDLAAVGVDVAALPATELGRSEDLQPGQWVLAMGHPWGVVGAAAFGVVIGVGIPPEMGSMQRELIQVDLPLRPGYSGGPLVDAGGRLVGINTMMAGPEVGLAVPVHEVKRFLQQALK